VLHFEALGIIWNVEEGARMIVMNIEVIVQMALVFVSYWNIGIQGGSFIQTPMVFWKHIKYIF